MIRFIPLAPTLAFALTLAACGADGEPEAPAPRPGATITGTVEFGVGGSF